MNKQRWGFLALFGFVAAVFTALTPAYIARYRLSFSSASGIYLCFLLLLAMAIAPGFSASREWIRRQLPARLLPLTLPAVWCVPYLVYALGTGDLRFSALLRLAAIAAVLPALYTIFPVRDRSQFEWQDLLVAAWLIASLLSHQLSGVWNVPVNLDFLGRLYLIIAGAWTWTYVRPIPHLGFELRADARTFRASVFNFLLFAVIALPIGLVLRFIAWNPKWTGWGAFGASYLQIFLFIALLEELFFRGFLQSLLASNMRSERVALTVVSVLFGLFHILHAPFPNWPYVVLATFAGWFYGSAFLQSGNLLAPALTHALVDTVWRTFFTQPVR